MWGLLGDGVVPGYVRAVQTLTSDLRHLLRTLQVMTLSCFSDKPTKELGPRLQTLVPSFRTPINTTCDAKT